MNEKAAPDYDGESGAQQANALISSTTPKSSIRELTELIREATLLVAIVGVLGLAMFDVGAHPKLYISQLAVAAYIVRIPKSKGQTS